MNHIVPICIDSIIVLLSFLFFMFASSMKVGHMEQNLVAQRVFQLHIQMDMAFTWYVLSLMILD